MSQGYKMVLIDLDGTTLTDDKRITARTQKILEHLDAHGIPVVIATGRAIYSIRDLFRHISLRSPVIALNGSIIYKGVRGNVWEYEEFGNELLTEILDTLKKRTEIENILLEGIGEYYVKKYDQEIEETFVHYRHTLPIEFHSEKVPESVTNLLILPREKKDEIHDWLNERLAGKIKMIKTSWHWLEGMREYVNKGSAMKKVADLYRIPLHQVVAFGDEWNDLEMLEEAGLSIAMENGSEEAKARADLIAPSNDREGVAVMLEEIFADLLVETKYA
ncbi:Cof-type HAD-IIB family hydrolase [Thermicanus aegyptius]|uniref:Cof-type HAD-IIB family hydrolase n=1 Tax=Thermicanus aegyptius TaxID=94009 RepID=UPI0003F4C373|nr:Cof-type HAD-IIB family hydrolase [Thermicanus aegyptius]